MRSTARSLAVGLAACAAVAVSGCGNGSSGAPAEPRAATLWSAVQKSVGTATSFHIDGVEPDNDLPVDLSITRGGDMTGTIRLDGATADIVKVGSKVYVKLTSELLQQEGAPAGACAQVCGRWAELSASQADLLAGPYSLSSFTDEIGASGRSRVTDAGSARVNGKAVWVVREPDGSIVDLSQKSKHYPLEIRAPGGNSGVLAYSLWDAVRTPEAPPASEVVRLASAGGLGSLY
jgi:hypothetical protein